MSDYSDSISTAKVTIPRCDLVRMVRLVHLLDRLSRQAAYREQVYPLVPEIARFDPGHAAVMMCYDFHLTDAGPQLIEVNTNAGGGLLAYLAQHPGVEVAPENLASALRQRLLGSFASEMQLFSAGRKSRPEQIAIIDDAPEQQHLYGEMQAFADLFTSWGVSTTITEPQQLQNGEGGLSLGGKPVDLVYNRHCDFYLEDALMGGVRQAYQDGQVCLTPNPHMYGLLGDKRRLIQWSSPETVDLLPLSPTERELLLTSVPVSRLLQDSDPDETWGRRRQLVFKPVTRFGSRGVLLGDRISHKRFAELPVAETLVQDLVTPSRTDVGGFGAMKTDLRLYAYRDRVLGVAARLYRGQVTNLRTDGGGFAPVQVL